MNAHNAARLLLLALTTTVASSCAHASTSRDLGPGDLAAGPDDDTAMCDLRVESAYDEPIEAGARAGAREVSLGTIEPDESVEILVPCSYGAVTVFRLVTRDGLGGDTRLGSRTQALDPKRTTVVTVRPEAKRTVLRPRG